MRFSGTSLRHRDDNATASSMPIITPVRAALGNALTELLFNSVIVIVMTVVQVTGLVY